MGCSPRPSAQSGAHVPTNGISLASRHSRMAGHAAPLLQIVFVQGKQYVCMYIYIYMYMYSVRLHSLSLNRLKGFRSLICRCTYTVHELPRIRGLPDFGLWSCRYTCGV